MSLTAGLYVCSGGLDIVKIDKTPQIHSISYFNMGGLEFCGGLSPPKTPMVTGMLELQSVDKAAYITSLAFL